MRYATLWFMSDSPVSSDREETSYYFNPLESNAWLWNRSLSQNYQKHSLFPHLPRPFEYVNVQIWMPTAIQRMFGLWNFLLVGGVFDPVMKFRGNNIANSKVYRYHRIYGGSPPLLFMTNNNFKWFANSQISLTRFRWFE